MKCDVSLLWTLVQQDVDPGEEADSIASHLEHCERCREKLCELGGDESWWDNAKECLSGDFDFGDDELGEGGGDVHVPMPPVDLSFLDAPTHPEMLGRIGRYDVEALLGRGGMGVVLRAYDSDLHRSVAVKVMAPEWAASMPARKRFAREAQAAASVAHENVIPIYNVEADAKLPFLVMLYVRGMTLERWVKTNGPPDPATILRVAGQMADGLSAAHRRGLVHRDIKPGNVLVGENNDRVWITDFGLARAADSVTLTQTGIIAGTPHYMSPEQARGESLDRRTDLFSFGCVLYFLCTGKPPFDAENTLAVLHKIVSEKPASLLTFRSDLPHSFVSLVNQLLSRPMSKRPPDCDAVSETLSIAQDELRDGRVGRPPINFKRAGLLASVVLILVAVALNGYAMLKQDTAYRPSFTSDRSVIASDSVRGGNERFSPYVVQASEQIVRRVDHADVNFANELSSIQREIKRLSRPDELTDVPIDLVRDEKWRRQITELQRLIDDQR